MIRALHGLLKEFGMAELNGQVATVVFSSATGLFALAHGELLVTAGEQACYHGTAVWQKCRLERGAFRGIPGLLARQYMGAEALDMPVRGGCMWLTNRLLGSAAAWGIALAPFFGSLLADVVFYACLWVLRELWSKHRRRLAGLLIAAVPAFAQVTSTDTEGKGGVDVFTSWSYYPAADVSTHAGDTLLLYGLTGRLDVMAGLAVNTGAGQRQFATEAGFQYMLFERSGWRILTLELATLPVNNRSAGTSTLFASVTINRELALGRWKLTPYAGYGPSFSLGGGSDRLFSYHRGIHNFPAGVMFPMVDKAQLFVEYGGNTPAFFSAGISYNLRKGKE